MILNFLKYQQEISRTIEQAIFPDERTRELVENEYIDRLNKLIPMEILMPLGGAGFVGHELNKE